MLQHSSRLCRHAIVRRSNMRNVQLRAAAAPVGSSTGRKNIVFLGTPEVAAIVLDELLTAAEQEGSSFQVAAVVSQPGKPKGRGNKAVPVPSPVEALARQRGLPDDRILCPATAKDPSFLEALSALQPDLCVTAAYGNMLPRPFLDLPRHGTLNIHPSLLPLYRGAAPVQRALQDGVSETGVSLAFTVLKCDAGPILAQQPVPLTGEEQAPALLEHCFRLGAQLLLQHLPQVWSGEAAAAARQQDESRATHAAKLAKEDGYLDPTQGTAATLHNKVRACAGWPGTALPVLLVNPATASSSGQPTATTSSSSSSNASTTASSSGRAGATQVQLKVLSSKRVAPEEVVTWLSTEAAAAAAREGRLLWAPGNKRLLLPCVDGSLLELLQVQPPTKKPMAPGAFFNGLGGKQLIVDRDALQLLSGTQGPAATVQQQQRKPVAATAGQ